MDLYAFAGEFEPEELRAFCRERKAKSPAEVFYIVAFFDTEANAKFPSNPITAEHTEEKELRHIRAVYVYNKANGFSELRRYEKNAWESRAAYEKP